MKRASITNLKRWRTYGAPTRIRAEKKKVDSFGNTIYRGSIHTVASVLPLNRSTSTMNTIATLTIGVALSSVFSFLFLGDSAARACSPTELMQAMQPSNITSHVIPSPTPACSPQPPLSDAEKNNPIRELDLRDALDGGLGTPDWDCDGVCNIKDNCIFAYNPDQKDSNGDGKGNVCDPKLIDASYRDSRCDQDRDGIPDFRDNCLIACNPGQEDSNNNGMGDFCDQTFPNAVLAFQTCSNPKKVKAPKSKKIKS